MSLHKINGKNVLDFTGNFDKTICEKIIEKMIKECEKEHKIEIKQEKRDERHCKNCISKIISHIEQLEYREKHNILVGYLTNKINITDKVYVVYDFILKSLQIYEIKTKFLQDIDKIKQKLENIIPQLPGIYILECENYIYIGEAVNILSRLIEHYLGFGSLCTKKYKITKIKQIIPFFNYPNYENIMKHKDYEGFKLLKEILLLREGLLINEYREKYGKERINPRK
jgi:hypothetical protein